MNILLWLAYKGTNYSGDVYKRQAYEQLNMPVPKHLRAEDADEVDGQQRMY